MLRGEFEYLKNLLEIWTTNVYRDMQEGAGKQSLTKLGYRMMDSGFLEETFKLARLIRSIKLLHDLAFFAEKEGFIGLALIAKHERESMDEHCISIHEELEKVMSLPGKTLTANDYKHLVHDCDEIMSISSISEAQDRGGYLVESNYWEINLEDYAKALLLEADGRYTEALAIYKANSLAQDIQRVEIFMSNTELSPCISETTVHLTALGLDE
mmetsp:Transcript_25678/g.44978  ORF Transcript_25678/g.44978 Transcript_25678/m.44978 type:complete len:213 (-) Transcript_25678:915-1553(-)